MHITYIRTYVVLLRTYVIINAYVRSIITYECNEKTFLSCPLQSFVRSQLEFVTS